MVKSKPLVDLSITKPVSFEALSCHVKLLEPSPLIDTFRLLGEAGAAWPVAVP